MFCIGGSGSMFEGWKHWLSPEIKVGSFVLLRGGDPDPETDRRLRFWIDVYGSGPFKVINRGPEHVCLAWIIDPLGRAKEGSPVHFGGAELDLHINHVELFEGLFEDPGELQCV